MFINPVLGRLGAGGAHVQSQTRLCSKDLSQNKTKALKWQTTFALYMKDKNRLGVMKSQTPGYRGLAAREASRN